MSFLKSGRRALAALALIAAGGAAHASSFAYTSTAGEPIGGGVGTRTLASPNATFVAGYASLTHVMIDVDQDGEHWNIQFQAPNYEADTFVPLYRGSYANAEHAALATPRAPGLEINGPYGNCLDAYGSFNIRQIEFDDYRQVTKLEATFTHRCGSTTAPVLSGTLYFEAKPRSYSYTRVAGNPMGANGPTAKSYYGDTSDISAGGVTSLLEWRASGQRDDWHFIATPPTGQQFTKGRTYALGTVADATTAAIDIEYNGEPVCINPAGTIKINNISTFPELGEVSGLYATYTIYCNGGTEPYKGTFRYEL
jgi:hypothetical protein